MDDRNVLVLLGEHLDLRAFCLAPWSKFAGESGAPKLPPSIRELLIAAALQIRDKSGQLIYLRANQAQTDFARRCTKRNIILKARQLGVTTYVASRFFLHTVTRPGTLTVQVAHDQSSAEEIFRIVHRFLAYLPLHLREDALMTSRPTCARSCFHVWTVSIG